MMDQSLYHSVAFDVELVSRYGGRARDRAMAILEAAGIPTPRSGEFLIGKESVLLFLHRYGLALRFGDRCHARPSDRILQPFALYDLSPTADFEVLPGVRVGGSVVDKLHLGFALQAQGVCFPRAERVASNIGMIGDGHKMVIDRGACTTLRHAFTMAAEPVLQNAYYAPFIGAAKEAFGTRPEAFKAAAFGDFLAMCCDNTAKDTNDPDKRLFNEWSDPSRNRNKSNYARQAAIAFDQRLAACP